jgi:retinol dehydrogenase 12
MFRYVALSTMALAYKKTSLITGGNAGLGLLTATELAKSGFRVTISVRSADKGEAAVAEVRRTVPDAEIDFLLMDMGDLASIRNFGSAFRARHPEPLDVLVNNAGIMATPFALTKDGNEAQFQVNHLSHFLLTSLLLPQLTAAASGPAGEARVVCVASRAHLRWQRPLDLETIRTVTPATYDRWLAYGRSKTANILFARGLAKRFGGTGVVFNSLHPGLVATGLLTKAGMGASGALPVEEGVRTAVFLATSPEVRGTSGLYFFDCKPVPGDSGELSSWAQSAAEEEALWNASLDLCGLRADEYGTAVPAAGGQGGSAAGKEL